MVEWKHCKRLNCVLTESSRIIWLQGYLGLATWNIIIFNIILKVFWGRTGHYEELLRVKLEIGEGEKNPPFYQNLQNDFFFLQRIAVMYNKWIEWHPCSSLLFFLTAYYRSLLLLILAVKVPLIVWQLWCGYNLRFKAPANLTIEAPGTSLMKVKRESKNTGVGSSIGNKGIIVSMKNG